MVRPAYIFIVGVILKIIRSRSQLGCKIFNFPQWNLRELGLVILYMNIVQNLIQEIWISRLILIPALDNLLTYFYRLRDYSLHVLLVNINIFLLGQQSNQAANRHLDHSSRIFDLDETIDNFDRFYLKRRLSRYLGVCG